jgi:8-oxo-dGTP diphosphatase
MDFEKALRDHFEKGQEKYLRHISIDCVIFGFHENKLKILLLKPKYGNHWALPGGFIQKKEHIDEAAHRILNERTGLNDIFLQQFHVFGDPARSPNQPEKKILKKRGIDVTTGWMAERFLSVGYYALVDFHSIQPIVDPFSESCQWCDINEVPFLYMDHTHILKKALNALRWQLNYHPVGYNLLPKKFTMPQLQKLYETILGNKLDRRNFQRKIIATGVLIRLNEQKTGVAHKAPYYYKFDLKKYHRALAKGLAF